MQFFSTLRLRAPTSSAHCSLICSQLLGRVTKLRRHIVTTNYAQARTGQPLSDGHNMHLPLKLKGGV